MKTHNYYIYILTNIGRKVLYIGVTNNVLRRLSEHDQDSIDEKKHFAGKYNAVYLIYWERFQFIYDAIAREKELKGWNRSKKEKLISDFNPGWKFLNEEFEF
jgi:putative endonuclease